MRRTMRGALAFLAALMLSCGLLAGSAWAADASAKITVGDAEATPGQEVTLPVNISENPGIAGFAFEVTLPDGVTLQSIEKANLLSQGTFTPNLSKSRVTWFADNDITDNGALMNLTLTAPEAVGTYSIAVGLVDGKAANFTNQNFEIVPVTFEVGTLTVANPEPQKIDISTCSVTLNTTTFTYDGTAKEPTVTVKYNGAALTKGTDYDVAYENNVNVGTAKVTVTGKGNYEGSQSVTFTITEPERINISKCTIVLSETSYEYDGTAKMPGVTVSYNSATLTEGTDYSVAYKNNVEVGVATVTVTGMGGYTGSKNVTFKINEPTVIPEPRDIADCSAYLAKTTFTYDGSAKKPSAVVKYGDRTLKEGTDYTMSYANNVEVGTATATITGIGDYTGSIELEFTIEEAPIIGDDEFVIENGKLIRYNGEATTVTVPDGVTSIGEDAFSFREDANAIIILPDSVTAIDDDAFIFETGISSITLSKNLKSIGSWAFGGCTGLTSITLPNGLTDIGERAFGGSGITSIVVPGTVAEIPSKAFYNCANLTEAVISSGVQVIGESAFSGCEALEDVAIPSSVTAIRESAFDDCKKLSEIALPEGVTALGDFAFNNCSSLSSITLPTSLTDIGINVLNGCTSLKRAVLSAGFESIGEGLFTGLESLEEVILPSTMKTIGASAFNGCTSLSAIDLPKGLTSIGGYAFEGCTSLESISIPASLTDVEQYAFYGCTNLTSATLAAGMTTVPNNLFYCCEYLVDVTIPSSVTAIGESAFEGCTSLSSVTVPSGVTTLGDYAFYECSGLESITFLGHAPSSIGSLCFADSVATVYTPGNDTTWNEEVIESLGSQLTWAGGGSGPELIDIATCTVTLAQESYTYDGSAKTPAVTVKDGSTVLAKGTDYTVEYKNNVKVGTATVTVTGKGNYTGSKNVTFEIASGSTQPELTDLSSAVIITSSTSTYTGRQITPDVLVLLGSTLLKAGTDYSVTYVNNINAGNDTAYVMVVGKGNYTGTVVTTFSIAKAANSLKLANATYNVKFKKVKKKAQAVAGAKLTARGQGTMGYSITKVNKAKFKKKFKINVATGKITVKKGIKKGTYKITVKAIAVGDSNYNGASKTAVVTIKVR